MTGLSLAGVAVAVIVVVYNGLGWWKAGKTGKHASHYLWGLLLGLLGTICVGGALGWAAAGTATASSSVGNGAVSKITGTPGAGIRAGSMGHLTPAGGVVVVIILAIVIYHLRNSSKLEKRRIVGGIYSGFVLGYLPGIAVLLAFLPEAVNAVGGYGAGAIGSAL